MDTLFELNYELRRFRPAPPAKRSDFPCYTHDSTSTQQKCKRKNVVARTDTDVLPGLANRSIQSLAGLTPEAYAAKPAK
jgi:hypothetical protein